MPHKHRWAMSATIKEAAGEMKRGPVTSSRDRIGLFMKKTKGDFV